MKDEKFLDRMKNRPYSARRARNAALLTLSLSAAIMVAGDGALYTCILQKSQRLQWTTQLQ